MLAACSPSPSPNPNPNPIPDPQCAGSCSTSQICQIGGPSVIFGSVELGLAAAIIEVPALKAPIRQAYLNIQTGLQQPNLTWGNVTALLSAQIAGAVGTQWAPLIQVLINRLAPIVSTTPVSACDLAFLQQHVVNVLAETAGMQRPYPRTKGN